jgi:large subunit ribosomal protein L15
MKLHELVGIAQKKAKRVGRGWGSGKGKYAGRGNKGQKSREKIKWLFEGGQAKINQHLPMLRGKGKNKVIFAKPEIVNVEDLESLSQIKDGMIIDEALFLKLGIIEKHQEVKLLGKGKLTKKLIIKIKASKQAVEKVQKASGEYQL